MSEYSEDARQHLAFIQAVIARMNSNSFSMKGWMVTVVAALAALYAADGRASCPEIYLYIALVPIILFWFLDTYYLMMERKYRQLYDDALAGKVELYSMKVSEYKISYLAILFSKSEWPVYLPVLVLIVVALVLFI